MKSSTMTKLAYVAAFLVMGCSGGDARKADVEATPAKATVALPSPAGATFSAAVSINDGNTAAGWAATPGGARAVSWAATAGQPPAAAGEHLPLPGNTHSAAYGINAGGHIVGESQKGTSSVAVAWIGGAQTPTELPLTGFSPPAVAFASAGDRIVGQATIAGRTVAVIWTTPAAAPVELDTLDTDGTSRAYAISPSGLVVGEATDNGAVRGVVWEIDGTGDVVDGPDPLAPLPGDIKSVALGVDGEVIVGESEAADGSVRAVRWTRSADTKNISPPLALGAGSASAVSGQRVAGKSGFEAVLWDHVSLGTPTVIAAAPSQALGMNALRSVVGFQGTSAFVEIGEAAGPATGVTLIPSVGSPQPVGSAVRFDAQGVGGSGTYQYKFWLFRNGTWEVMQDYGVGSSWIMPTTIAAGRYQVAVHVRTDPSVFVDAQAVVTFVIGDPPPPATPATGVTLTPSLTSPQAPGTAIRFDAQGQGGTGEYQYRFWLFRNGGWEVVQDYGPGASWTLPASTAAGTYQVAVHVRTDPLVVADAQGLATFVIGTPAVPATGVTLTPNVASPQPLGTPVRFDAEGLGSPDAYQYRFWLFLDGAWHVVQEYGAAASWTMPTTLPEGRYRVAVHVRTSVATVAEAEAIVTYVVGAPPVPTPASGATLIPTLPSPQASGTAVRFDAQGEGSTDAYQYRFWLFVDGGWQEVQPYGPTPNWTLPASTPPGSYLVAVHVRTDPAVLVDVQTVIPFVVF